MKIQPFVEGAGEVEAVPVLLRRLQAQSGAYALEILRPICAHRSDLLSEPSVRMLVRRARVEQACDGLLFLLDGDDDCPLDLAPKIGGWVGMEAGIPCAVVIAQREYEAWFLASLESLRGRRGIRSDSLSLANPEEVRGAKERLQTQMAGRVYRETADQPALTARFDMASAYRRCRSFRRMVRAFGLLAAGAGISLEEWPPASWIGPAEDRP